MTDGQSLEHLVLAAGPNVRIRARVRADGPDEFRWRSDPENARYDGRSANMEPLQRFLDAFVYELAHGHNDREQFAIDAADGTHIGTVMLYNFSRGGEAAEVGISLGEEAARNRGFGREAMILFLGWVWANRPVRHLYLHALEWNERAMRSFRAAGFGEVARVLREERVLIRMEVRREWWLLWEMEGRFTLSPAAPGPTKGDTAVTGTEPTSASVPLER